MTLIKQTTCMSELIQKLGYTTHNGSNYITVKKYLEKLSLPQPAGYYTYKHILSDEEIFCNNSTASQSTLRKRYKKNNITPYKCAICGLDPMWNNKPLVLTLDHINGHHHDNRLENLRWVCPNCDRQLDTYAGKNLKNVRKHSLKKKHICKDCGKEISNGATRCVECSHKLLRRSERPDKDTLQNLITTKPFVQIGKMYGVSDNAVRKWCKAYDLPYKYNDIKKLVG